MEAGQSGREVYTQRLGRAGSRNATSRCRGQTNGDPKPVEGRSKQSLPLVAHSSITWDEHTDTIGLAYFCHGDLSKQITTL